MGGTPYKTLVGWNSYNTNRFGCLLIVQKAASSVLDHVESKMLQKNCGMEWLL